MARVGTILKPSYIIIGILAFLILGRYVGSPISIVIVSGTSMRPTLDIGDLAFLIKDRDLDKGDIVLWCRDNLNCILHRVYQINSTYVSTKGDANEIPDPPIPIEKIEYKALFTLPSYIWIPFIIIALYLIVKYEDREERIS